MRYSISKLIALRRLILFSTLFLATAITSFSQTTIKIDPIEGIYFGQTLPGETPVLSSADEYGAHLSSDGKFLFFTRHTARGNGIYWVASSAIEKLK